MGNVNIFKTGNGVFFMHDNEMLVGTITQVFITMDANKTTVNYQMDTIKGVIRRKESEVFANEKDIIKHLKQQYDKRYSGEK